jgi:hypothetical protein
MHMRRASYGSARPLNCDVMRRHRAAASIGFVALTLSAACYAQGITLIERCPEPLGPIKTVSVQLPVDGEHEYAVTAEFIVDVNGSVVAPKVKESQLVRARRSVVPVPANVDAAFIRSLSKWKYGSRSKPCTGSLQLKIIFDI